MQILSHVGRSLACSWHRELSFKGDTYHQGYAQKVILFNSSSEIKMIDGLV